MRNRCVDRYHEIEMLNELSGRLPGLQVIRHVQEPVILAQTLFLQTDELRITVQQTSDLGKCNRSPTIRAQSGPTCPNQADPGFAGGRLKLDHRLGRKQIGLLRDRSRPRVEQVW